MKNSFGKSFNFMKTSNFIVLLFFCFNYSYSQNGFTNVSEAKNETINGLKQGKWVEYYDKIGSTTKEKAENYVLGVYQDGKVIEISRRYSMNGVLISEFPYQNGIVHGLGKMYYESGKLKYEIPLLNGKTEGLAKEYFESGKILGEYQYVNDKLNGKFLTYDESSKLIEEVNYVDDVKEPTTAESEKAKLTYELAVEEYEKGDYIKASQLLSEVFKLEPKSKSKVAFMQAKCFEPLLFKSDTYANNYFGCIYWIDYYMEVGTDEVRKKELLRLKIKIESSADYKVAKEAKEYEKMSKSDALKMLYEAKRKFPRKEENLIDSNIVITSTDFMLIDAGESNSGSGVVFISFLSVSLKSKIIFDYNYEPQFKNDNGAFNHGQYASLKKFNSNFKNDISTYLKQGSIASRKGFIYDARHNRNIYSVWEILIRIYDAKSASDDYNKKMGYVLYALFND